MPTYTANVPNQLMPLCAGGMVHHPVADHIASIRCLCQCFAVDELTEKQQLLLKLITLECDGIINELTQLARHNHFGIQP